MRKKKSVGNMRRQFFVVDQGKDKSPRYAVKLVMGYTPEQKRPKRVVSPGYLTRSTADKHAAELNRKGSRGVMKKLSMTLDNVWDLIEEKRREVEIFKPDGKSITVKNKSGDGNVFYWVVPKGLTYGGGKNKNFTWNTDRESIFYGRGKPSLKSDKIMKWLSKSSGVKVNGKTHTYKWRWNAKWNTWGKALDRLTDYALGKRTKSYDGKARAKDRKALKRQLGIFINDVESYMTEVSPQANKKRLSQKHLQTLESFPYGDYPVFEYHKYGDLSKEEVKYLLSKEGQDYIIERNKPYRRDLGTVFKQGHNPALTGVDYDGVVLFSGGLDSVALGIMLASNPRKAYLPVYISHRSNVGNVTKKEILAARKLAKKIFREELLVFKKGTKSGKVPDWYGKRVYETDTMPVPKNKKNERNRRFLQVLKENGLADKEIWLGVLGIPGAGDRSRAAGRAQDVTKEGLQKHLKKLGAKGKIKVVRDIEGVKTKADLLKGLPFYVGTTTPTQDLIVQSQSCLMYFNKPCGDCWSCVERVESMVQAYGRDKTPYRKDSKADKYKRSEGGNLRYGCDVLALIVKHFKGRNIKKKWLDTEELYKKFLAKAPSEWKDLPVDQIMDAFLDHLSTLHKLGLIEIMFSQYVEKNAKFPRLFELGQKRFRRGKKGYPRMVSYGPKYFDKQAMKKYAEFLGQTESKDPPKFHKSDDMWFYPEKRGGKKR